MASAMLSTPTMANVNRSSPVKATMIAPVTGFRSSTLLPGGFKPATKLPSYGRKSSSIKCMKVWPTKGLIKFETLSYLPPLSREQLAKEIAYLIRMKWIPCLEFQLEHPVPYRENSRMPGYYDGRYWTMWKLPMYGCTDPLQVLLELDEGVALYPDYHFRILGFDNVRQVQCISFLAYKPPHPPR